MTQTNRLHWVDIGKGILILLLLVHHFGSAVHRTEMINMSDFWFVTLWQPLFTAFFMQAFLFMSGFCSNFKKEPKDFIIGLLKQIIIPFLVFEFLVCIYWSGSITKAFDFWIASGGTHYWFLNALALSKIYIYLFIRITDKNWLLLASTFLLLIVAVFFNDFDLGPNFMCLRLSVGSIFFVALGYVIKGRQELLERNTKYLIWIYPLLILACFLLHIRVPSFTAGMDVHLKVFPLFILTSISGIYIYIYICKKLQKNTFFEYFGRNSLIVYCLHFIPLLFFTQILYSLILPETIVMRLLYILALYAAEVSVCALLIEIFKYPPFKWIIGRY